MIVKSITPIYTLGYALVFSIGLLNPGILSARMPAPPDTTITSGNPIIKHIRSADPSAQVWKDGKVWVYCSHDPNDAVDYSTLNDYHVFSSYDMINWTDHGVILSTDDVSWNNPNGGFMYAPDAAYKNGTYYLFFPTLRREGGWRIGVATSVKPEGPFTDVGHYIEGTDEIDPTCFVDDDGQAYLIWGGGGNTPKIAKLKENMSELAEEPRLIDYGSDNFGEGPFMHKRGDTYYFSYTCNTCWPIQGFYAMADNPYGPFEYKGELNRIPPGAQDHHSIIEYHHQWYYFYHVGNYGPDGSAYRRNVCVDSLYYNEDGTMQLVKQTSTGVGADKIGMTEGIVIPGRIEAEDFFSTEGIERTVSGDTATLISQINSEDRIDYVLNILGSESYIAEIKVKNPVAGTSIYFLLDEVATDTLNLTDASDTLKTSIYLNHGKHLFRMVFSNPSTENNLMEIDWIDLYGQTEYQSIESKTSGGGSVYPLGMSYYPTGDSAVYVFTNEVNFILDTLLIDGEYIEPKDSYTFYDLAENHILEARFSSCNTTVLSPYYKVNNADAVAGSDIIVTECDSLSLMIDYDQSFPLIWSGPDDQSGEGNSFDLDSVQLSHTGTYTALLINDIGCSTKMEFTVNVNYLDLDVFEAEDYFSQAGTNSEICKDLGGGRDLINIENNDWCYYNIEVDSSATYMLTARVATETEGGSIDISIMDSLLASIIVNGERSDGWQDWFTTEPVKIFFEEGLQKVKFIFKGGEGKLFNFNWFDLNMAPADTSISDTTKLALQLSRDDETFYSYSSEDGRVGVVYSLNSTSQVSLDIISITGSYIRQLVSPRTQEASEYHLTWDGTANDGTVVSPGLYFLILSRDNKKTVLKMVYTQ